jgi:AcrR family transcriptional regulator
MAPLSSSTYTMYNENMPKPAKRPYRKRKRAEAEEETRRRITEAAVELHGTVGPAQTTLTDVAKAAGVSRMTVYSHFPTDVDLMSACSSHWGRQNPFPDPSAWTAADPPERLAEALRELYGWYDRKQQMLGLVLRDMPSMPALAEVMGGFWGPWMAEVVGTLSEGWPGRDPAVLDATLRLATDFGTWRVLTESGLDNETAAGVMTRMVGCVGAS